MNNHINNIFYHNMNNTVLHALLHLLCQVSLSERRVPTAKRNEILVKYLKPKLKDRQLANIKKELKLMIHIARNPSSNLEEKLYELNRQAIEAKTSSRENLIKLLVYLKDHEGFDSQVFDDCQPTEPEVLYMLSDHIEHCFDDTGHQIAPFSMLVESPRANHLLDIINQHGLFRAEMKEWNEQTHQAHLLLHSND
ncbi:DUF2913 family protein [Vibrio algivorus]|nr:DUF2913 family protein [Vibrio algivorus]